MEINSSLLKDRTGWLASYLNELTDILDIQETWCRCDSCNQEWEIDADYAVTICPHCNALPEDGVSPLVYFDRIPEFTSPAGCAVLHEALVKRMIEVSTTEKWIYAHVALRAKDDTIYCIREADETIYDLMLIAALKAMERGWFEVTACDAEH